MITGPSIIRELDGTLNLYPTGSFGVVIAPSIERFSPGAIKRAKMSIYNIILTDEAKICKDIIDFVAGRPDDDDLNFTFFILLFCIYCILAFCTYLIIRLIREGIIVYSHV